MIDADSITQATECRQTVLIQEALQSVVRADKFARAKVQILTEGRCNSRKGFRGGGWMVADPPS